MAGNLIALATPVTEEIVSGTRAVMISLSGNVRIAMASVSGRMPAIGVVLDDLVSGASAPSIYRFDTVQPTSGAADYSGQLGLTVFVGRSGQLVTMSGSWNSGGFLSGDLIQDLGTVSNSGSLRLDFGGQTSVQAWGASVRGFPLIILSGNISSGSIGPTHHASGSVQSGSIGSGAVQGQSGGGAFHIASGSISQNDIAAGGITSGNYASGSMASGHMASGFISALSTTLVSGSVQSGNIASGAVQGFFGSTRHIASGTVGKWDLGSGAVNSGQLASGAVSRTAVGPNAVSTIQILATSITDKHAASGATISQSFVAGGSPSASGVFIGFTDQVNPAPIVSLSAESVSGHRAISFNQSGQIQIAMAGVSGRMPAIGLSFDTAVSGGTVAWLQVGGVQGTSGMWDFSGFLGKTVWVGRSGQLVAGSGSWHSGGWNSGDLVQAVGTVANSGGIYANVSMMVFSGSVLSQLGPF